MGQLQPIATPINISGIRPRTLRQFAPYLAGMGLVPVATSGSAQAEDWEDRPLEAGSTVGVQLVRGDLNVSATGTVTMVSGDKVYAFGHPFLSIGYTDLPLTKAAVLGIIPSFMNGQKMSATMDPVGSIKQDRSTGILGIVGQDPEMIPVSLKLTTSRKQVREYRYEVVKDSFLTSFLLTVTVFNSIVSSERSIGGQTVQVSCQVSLKDYPVVNFENSVSDLTSSPAGAAIAAAAPVHFILTSGFEDIVVKNIELELTAHEQVREAVLDKVWQDKIDVRAGEEVGVTLFLRKPNGDVIAEKYPVKIPDGIGPGALKIMIGDGLSVAKLDAQHNKVEFTPKNLGQLVKAINNLKKNDRFYIRLFREQKGAVIGGEGFPGLPPSLLALYSARKTTGDTQPINRVIFVEHELPSTDYVLTGQKVIEVNVKG
jgi:hypothetical protein